jgi:hypothetical protein
VRPASAAKEAEEGYKAGIGTIAIGGKFDFYGDERRGISVAVIHSTIHRGSSHPDSASRSADRSRGRSPR